MENIMIVSFVHSSFLYTHGI